MTTFRIRHHTSYTYDAPIRLGDHRLMIRPRGGHDMRVIESSLVVSPPADVRWAFDTFGNSVAMLAFEGTTDALLVVSELTVRRYTVDEPSERIARHAEPYPFSYDIDELVDLAPLMGNQFPADRDAVERWIAGFMPQPPMECLKVLNRVGDAIHQGYVYGRREARGTQSPGQTIARGGGTCRDFALLFMEAARLLGFAARFVTGYLYDPGPGGLSTSMGSTHAWADVFIPGVGWTEFDPTNRFVADRNLLRVATTRTPSQALPVSGVYVGAALSLMSVEVGVWRLE